MAQSDLVTADVRPAPAARPSATPRRGLQARPWLVRAHRWLSLAIGGLILVEVLTGTLLLYLDDISRWMHPERYRATVSATPLAPIDALAMVRQRHPELRAEQVQQVGDVYAVRGPRLVWDEPVAFVDPGSGTVNAIGAERSWFIKLVVNVHDCALACEGYPAYQAWLNHPLPGWGLDLTVGRLLLSSLGALFCVVLIGGLAIWWPPRNRWRTAFRLRLRHSAFARDLDLHKVVGVLSLPFVLMWAFTAAAFYFEWPEKLYSAALPGTYTADVSEPTRGTGPLVTPTEARAVAERLHPGAELVGVIEYNLTGPDGYYRFALRDGVDPYRYSSYGGNIRVIVDSHGGGIIDTSARDAPLTQRLWDDRVYNGLHYGTIVPAGWRVVWVVFGLAPALLAVTGLTMWLTRRRSRAARRAASIVGA
jgi:uncharacterized iron-regulated membrane protein